MARKRFTVDQIIRIIAEAELPSMSNASFARKYGISEQTLYRWRKKCRGLSASQVKMLKALEEENRRLKRPLAEKELEIQLPGRFDNEPEFRAKAFVEFASSRRVKIHYIEPGKPFQNGFSESFIGKFRDECLVGREYKNLREAREKIYE